MEKINCKEIAENIKLKVKEDIEKISSKGNKKPVLVVVQVGEDYASTKYVGNKIKTCNAVGIQAIHETMSESSTTEDIIAMVNKLNEDDNVDGIIVQLPLPKHVDECAVTQAINSDKDIDGLTIKNIGALHYGKKSYFHMAPCTPAGIIEILNSINYDLKGKSALVIGRSDIVGKPLAALLTQKNATVTLAHSHSEYNANNYDVVVSAIGKAKHIKVNNDKAILIDVGINFLDGKMVGDFDIENCNCYKYTSVPGGVGQLTVAMVCKNVLRAYCKKMCLELITR